MKNATSVERIWRTAGTGLFRMVHGSLLALGLVAVVFIGSGRFDEERTTSFDALVSEASAAEVPQTASAPVAVAAPETEEDLALSREMSRVRDWVSRRYKVSTVALEPVLQAAEEAGKHVGIDPLLIVAVMAVESSFNPFAESQAGAQGLMQVIPRFHMDKIGDDGGKDALFDPELNVRVGTLVLQEGLRRYGSLQSALQYYGGALSDPAAAYARKVLAMKQRLNTAAGRKAGSAA
ncbi:transglycosylase SLT domain-containing protein [Azoarcus sp. L1K30]|uniref:lytic transglycosylase domain-containing protein n=1 Tax=Azoarcus sp. L1K30 TaxID=2820277 RepID=UPI001B836983|nr:transglycosylase SLT domain-containing protein [Azoarcus sp. L1K30]MBR0568613.1 transglycosylase SLT domain-containing protein [Azoarcus sp. L1K30]